MRDQNHNVNLKEHLFIAHSQKEEVHNGTYAQGQHKKYRSEQCKAEDDVPDSVHCPPLLLFL